MAELFQNERRYAQDDPLILDLLGPISKQAQMRYHKRSPSYFKIGRRVIYSGRELNAWAEANHVDTMTEVRT